MSLRTFIFSAIGLLILLLTTFGYTQEGLPPVRQLVVETLALVNADVENNAQAVADLAAAQTYLGDFSAARKLLSSSMSEDFRITVARLHCAQIEIELTGSVASIPDSLWKFDEGTMRCKAALAFIQRGEIKKALEQTAQVPKVAHSALSVFGIELIQKLKVREDKEACREVALAWASRLKQADADTAFRVHYEVARLVAWLVEFDERPAAAALCEHWHSVLKDETTATASYTLRANHWAEYASAAAVLGDKGMASSALDQAYACLEKGLASEFRPVRRSICSSLAEGYAAAAAHQAAIFGPEKAAEGYRRAFEFASLSIDSRDRRLGELAYEVIAGQQLTANDEQGARETCGRAPSPARQLDAGCGFALTR